MRMMEANLLRGFALCDECGWPTDPKIRGQFRCGSGVTPCPWVGSHGHGLGYKCHKCKQLYAYHSPMGRYPGQNPATGFPMGHPDRA